MSECVDFSQRHLYGDFFLNNGNLLSVSLSQNECLRGLKSRKICKVNSPEYEQCISEAQVDCTEEQISAFESIQELGEET